MATGLFFMIIIFTIRVFFFYEFDALDIILGKIIYLKKTCFRIRVSIFLLLFNANVPYMQ